MRADMGVLGRNARRGARESSLCILTLRRTDSGVSFIRKLCSDEWLDSAGRHHAAFEAGDHGATPARDPQSNQNRFPIGGPFNAFAKGSVPRPQPVEGLK